jgi:hypothetical protein
MKRVTAGWVIVALAACKSEHRTAPAVKADVVTGSGGIAEARFGPPNPGGDRELAFAVTKVYDGQTPTSTPPYHAPGGTWTYFDARLVADPAATFGIGIPTFGSAPEPTFSKVWILPTTPDAGTHFVAAFAKAFHVAVPPPHPGTLAPMKMSIAVLGVGLGNSGDGFEGAGTWDATKLFLSNDQIDSAELFFNIDLAGKQGVFSEKDEEYNADDARVLADVLRDGQPPPRTPDNDLTLAARPVTFELGKRVASRHAMLVGSSDKRALLTETLDDHAALIAVELATGEVKELYRTPAKLYDGVCDAAAEHCLLPETHGKDRHSFSSDEPATLLVLDGDKVTPLDVPNAGDTPRAKAISPGGRFALVDGDRQTVIFDRKTHTSTVDRGKDYREILSWRGETVAVVSREDLTGDLHAPKKYAAWHLDTGKLEPTTAPPARDDATSPDGSRTVVFGGGKVTVTPNGGAARTLQLDPRDAQFAEAGCCPWLDSRYLTFQTRTFGLIDTDAMKVAFPEPSPEDERRIEPLPGSLHAFVTKGDDLYLARIVP